MQFHDGQMLLSASCPAMENVIHLDRWIVWLSGAEGR